MTPAQHVVGLCVAVVLASSSASSGCSRGGRSAPRADSASAGVAGDVAEPRGVDPAGTYMGRPLASPMSYRGAAWLDRSEREATEQPEHVLDVIAIREGSAVADVGAGSGYFTVRLAKRVGARGRVLATDLQPEMLALLREKLAAARLGNVTALLATETDARLPRGELDLVLMVDVYHELPRPAETLAEVRVALRPGGRLVLVEYRGEDASVPIKEEHKMTLPQIRKELGASGFVFRTSEESLPWQRIVVFGVGP